MPRPDYTAPTFVDVAQAQWGSPPAGAVALDAAHVNAMAQAIGNSAVQYLINVRNYGAKGDGATDDTAAIQAALNASTLSSPKAIHLPAGVYLVSGELTFPFAPGTRVFGDGRGTTVIRRTTSGGPIIAFRSDLTHNISFHDMTVEYSTRQTATTSVAFLYRVAGGSAAGFFYHSYHRMEVGQAYRGFAVADDAGAQTLWASEWQTVNLVNIKDRAISLSPATPIGIPTVLLSNVGVYNTGGGGLTSTGPAFSFTGCEVTAYGLDVEGWTDTIISMSGGGYVTVRGMHVETHHFAAGQSRMIYAANGPIDINGFSFVGANTSTNTDAVQLMALEAGATGALRNGIHNVDTTTSGAAAYIKEVFYAGTDTSVSFTAENVVKTGGGLNQPGTGSFGAYTAAQTTSLGRLPSGQVGLQLPTTGKVYLYSPDGTRYALSVANGGTVTVTAAPLA